MKRMRKIGIVITILAIVLSLVGCKSSLAYTFTLTTGDNIKIKLNTSDDWSLKQKDGSFTILHGEETILKGAFGTLENYKTLEEAIRKDNAAKVIKESKKDGNDYIFYSYEGSSGTEHHVILMVKDAKSCVILAGTAKEKDVSDALERLTITKE